MGAGPDAGSERLALLRQAKLAALVRKQWGPPTPAGISGAFPGGATLLGGAGHSAWVLIDDGPVRSFGVAVAWATGVGATALDVMIDAPGPPTAGLVSAAALVARRAGEFFYPAGVWVVSGRELAPAVPAALGGPGLGAPADDGGYADLLRRHGVEPVVEHGVLRGEVLGLEVARVEATEEGWCLVVGVGRQDRRARAELRPGEDAGPALDEVVAVVKRWRAPGARRHPANTLARERWLRHVVCSRPGLVGAAELAPSAPSLPVVDLRRPAPAPAAGQGLDGAPMVVVCSTGVDVDLVPTAADCRLLATGGRPGARLVLAVPEGDDHPITRRLAAQLTPRPKCSLCPEHGRPLGSSGIDRRGVEVVDDYRLVVAEAVLDRLEFADVQRVFGAEQPGAHRFSGAEVRQPVQSPFFPWRGGVSGSRPGFSHARPPAGKGSAQADRVQRWV